MKLNPEQEKRAEQESEFSDGLIATPYARELIYLRDREEEAREIIDSMIIDLAIRAKIRSGISGLQEDAALDMSDGILQRAEEFMRPTVVEDSKDE